MSLSIDTTACAGDDVPVPEPELEMGVLEQGFFSEADADNDGYVSKSEFVAYCYKVKGRSPGADDWKVFYAADANGDGRISREEFEKYVEARWVNKSGSKPQLSLDTINVEADADGAVPEPACELGVLEVGFFDAADTDGDGFVSKAEFGAYRLKQCGQVPSPDDWKAFYAADVNGDGRISRSEFNSFVASQWAGSKFQHEAGDRVVVHSLRSATEHNGKAGTIVAFNPVNGRYAVRMDDGSALSVRPGNLGPEGKFSAVDTRDAVPPPADVALPDEDPEIQRARSEQEISDAPTDTAAAQVARLERQRNARVQAEARAQLAQSRSQQKEEALAAVKAQLAQVQATRNADSLFNARGHGNADSACQGVATAESHAYANGRRWTEAEVLELEAEVVALRRSIFEQPSAGESSVSEAARIDQMLTSYLGPRDPYFAQAKHPQPVEASLSQAPPPSGRVGLSREWLQLNSSTRPAQANDAAARSALSTVRAQIAQLRSELGVGSEGTLT